MIQTLNKPAVKRATFKATKAVKMEILSWAVKATPAIIADCQDINTMLGIFQTPAFYGTHYANPALGSYGIMGIIRQVLTATAKTPSTL